MTNVMSVEARTAIAWAAIITLGNSDSIFLRLFILWFMDLVKSFSKTRTNDY